MRIRPSDRILAALSGLIVLALAVLVFLFGTGLLPFTLTVANINPPEIWWHKAIYIAAALVLAALGIFNILLLFRKDKSKNFVVQHTEYGDMSISMNAMQNMVEQVIGTHQEVKADSASIHHSREGIGVELKLTLPIGTNIPLTVSALQKQIKQYITSCSGVDVSEVKVKVETDTARLMPPETQIPEEQPETENVSESPSIDSFLQHTETPEAYAEVPTLKEEPADLPVQAVEAEVEVPQPESEQVSEPVAELTAEAEAEPAVNAETVAPKEDEQ